MFNLLEIMSDQLVYATDMKLYYHISLIKRRPRLNAPVVSLARNKRYSINRRNTVIYRQYELKQLFQT